MENYVIKFVSDLWQEARCFTSVILVSVINKDVHHNITEIVLRMSLNTHITITFIWIQVPLVEQELLALPEYLSSPPNLSEVRISQSLLFYVVFCRSLLVLLVIVLFVVLRFALFQTFLDYLWLSLLNYYWLIQKLVYSRKYSLYGHPKERHCISVIQNELLNNGISSGEM